MYQGYKLGIVVPAYNEAMLIEETLKDMPYDADRIYVINDASTDNTGHLIKGFKADPFSIISNSQNRGVGATIITGYQKALEDNIDIVVVMAGDKQMDVKYLPKLLEPIIRGKADYAKGNRLSKLEYRRGMSNWRLFGNYLLSLLTKIASGYWEIGDSQNGYTAITADALKKIDLNKVYPRYGYCNDLLVKLNVAGCMVVDVPIPARYGREKSKIKYHIFVIKVSLLLLQDFLWRLRMTYMLRRKVLNRGK